MPIRKIRLADHRGREATVLLVPRRRPPTVGYTDSSNVPVRFRRLLKSTESNSYATLQSRYGDPEALAQALIEGDPEIDMQAAGCETGPCDRVFTGSDGKPLYSTRMVEVVYDREGNEITRREPVDVPSNLVPDAPPQWSGKLIPKINAIRQYAFTRAYQIRHSNGLEFDFLFGLARRPHPRRHRRRHRTHLQPRRTVVCQGGRPDKASVERHRNFQRTFSAGHTGHCRWRHPFNTSQS